jgi:hypothetical protein
MTSNTLTLIRPEHSFSPRVRSMHLQVADLSCKSPAYPVHAQFTSITWYGTLIGQHVLGNTIMIDVRTFIKAYTLPAPPGGTYRNGLPHLTPVVQYRQCANGQNVVGHASTQRAPQNSPSRHQQSKSTLNVHLQRALEEIEVPFQFIAAVPFKGHEHPVESFVGLVSKDVVGLWYINEMLPECRHAQCHRVVA